MEKPSDCLPSFPLSVWITSRSNMSCFQNYSHHKLGSRDSFLKNVVPLPEKHPKLGFYVYLLAGCAVIGGFLFGYDTGVVSGSMLYIVDYDGMKPMTSIWKELIISITPGMAIIGALGSSPFADRWGRRPVIIASAVLFAIGGVVWIASMIIPIYIGEAAPSYIRGSLITTFQVMIAFGQVIANFVAGVFSYANPVYTGWRFMLGLASVPGIIQLIGFFFLPESPRFLFYKNRKDEAEKVGAFMQASASF
ncbi:unnamed protein product [Toxocara canis]|uniref:MFS domain-containing protein n=1 Tax=Toxocara canis TaxID=6265 RepID=A0A183U4M2_TOXCA|nr:unnamed protein product [Toxocara canis]